MEDNPFLLKDEDESLDFKQMQGRLSKAYQQRRSEAAPEEEEVVLQPSGLDLLAQMEQLELKMDDPFAMLRNDEEEPRVEEVSSGQVGGRRANNKDNEEPNCESIDLETQILQVEARNQVIQKKKMNRMAENSTSIDLTQSIIRLSNGSVDKFIQSDKDLMQRRDGVKQQQ